MMSRKDYVKFSEILNTAKTIISEYVETGKEVNPRYIRRFIANEMVKVFVEDNPNFDRTRFEIAAGLRVRG